MSTSINTTAITSAVNAALNAVGTYRDAIVAIKKAVKGQTSPKEVRGLLLGPVAGFYGVALLPKTKGEGFTMDVDARGFEAAKKALYRLTKDVCAGQGNAQRDSVEPTAEMVALAAKLVRLCNEYEGAGRLIAAAIATAKAA